ncbi:hypothetical protein KQX54_015277 [Cotesia glomerata]|uniref:Uncharacterized protein n=1 Tax=Cotesia glomerata TaxID=32391 RepID=A0AAV7J7S7_COTGL|nr:hypothetical protein KQX54_015277 [Cotesia glomerata]
MRKHNRLTTSPMTYRSSFISVQERYRNCDEYFTDGSVIENRSGFAVVTNTSIIHSYRMHDYCPIWAYSLSNLLALKNQYSKHPLIQLIHKTLEELEALGKSDLRLGSSKSRH